VLAAVALIAVGGHLVRLSRLEHRNRELLKLHEQRETAREDLRVAYDRLRRLTRRLEAAKEDERKRIARELHDELGQTLTAVRINVQLLRQNTAPASAEKRFKETTALVDQLIERIGDMSLDLRPPLLDDLGLVLGLRGYLGALAKRSGIRLEVHGDDVPTELPAEVEIVGFRVVQEAVTNAIRHAGAKRVTIDVRRTTDGLEITVKDDGSGFDIKSTMKRAYAGQHLGLLGIEERVHMLDGELTINSVKGEGTEIRVRLPMEVGS
jgi:signal transduction histidine kinase